MSVGAEQATEWTFDVSARDFDARVARAGVPVLVDFWAPWCGPCKAIAPILDRLVSAYAGRLHVARVNVDEEQTLATGFGIRSIPTLVLFAGGKVAGQLTGLQNEAQLRELVEPHVEKASNPLRIAVQDALLAQDHGRAIELLQQALAVEQDHPGMLVDLARAHLALGQSAEAAEAVRRLPVEVAATNEITALKSQIEIQHDADGLPDLDTLRSRVSGAPDDARLRYQLGLRAASERQYQEAMASLLEAMRLDRKFDDDAARRALLRVFSILGNADSDVQQYRRRMASLLN